MILSHLPPIPAMSWCDLLTLPAVESSSAMEIEVDRLLADSEVKRAGPELVVTESVRNYKTIVQ